MVGRAQASQAVALKLWLSAICYLRRILLASHEEPGWVYLPHVWSEVAMSDIGNMRLESDEILTPLRAWDSQVVRSEPVAA